MIVSLLPLVLQGFVMSIDELIFHRKRGLGRWERIGHPIDSFFFAVCAFIALSNSGDIERVKTLFIVASILSCAIVTKDEFVHAKECEGAETFLHSLLFVLHPICLYSLWRLGAAGETQALGFVFAGVCAFMLHQIFYWNVLPHLKTTSEPVNNSVYDDLGDGWYTADADPVALLRAEARLKNPWVESEIAIRLGTGSKRVLDVGCGAGFLANHLAARGHRVCGLDASAPSLTIAKKHDVTSTVDYVNGDAYRLPFPDASFDVVCAMDFLEHVEDPGAIVREASRVLAPGGLLFFHTFNRNWLSGFVVIRLMEWFVKGTPKNLHVYRLFIRPKELANFCESAGLRVDQWSGIAPDLFSRAALDVLLTGRVGAGFSFSLSRSLSVGYLGIGSKSLPVLG